MLGATMSLLGLYDYDPTILDDMALPDGIDTDILFPDMLAECADLEILYPDADTFRTILKAWSSHRKPVWERIVTAASLEYNPIENYDRMEDWTDMANSTNKGTLKNYAAGYNPNVLGVDPAMVQQDQAESTGSNSGGATHKGRTHGNIGVTTSQQMLQQELDVAGKLDPYAYIIKDFKMRFCIPLY